MKSPRYDKKTRTKLQRRIRQLFAEGNNRFQIYEALNLEGYRNPSGELFTERQAYNQMYRARLNFKSQKNRLVQQQVEMSITMPRKSEVLPIAELILQSDIGEEKKIAMIRALVSA